ncbi:hypothetical protein HAX54_021134, partial [Datura stramonium]|nr:hypothetical protein [Datura stramonium]
VEGALPLLDLLDEVIILQIHDQNQGLGVPERDRKNVGGDPRIAAESPSRWNAGSGSGLKPCILTIVSIGISPGMTGGSLVNVVQ